MRYAVALGFALHIGMGLAPVGPMALAQGPPAPRDSTRADSAQSDSILKDSLPPDSIRGGPIHDPRMYLMVYAGIFVLPVVLVTAPAPLAKWWGEPGRTAMAFLDDHWAAYVSVGGYFHRGQTWAHSASLEVLRKSVHAELHVEDFWRPRHVRYFTLRAGYLWHPRRRAAGGVTLGYVHADRDPAQRGLEIGVPLFVGSSSGTMRLEPTYVLSSSGLLWSGRLQLEFHIPGGPYFVGANMVGKSLQLRSDPSRDDLAARAVTLLFGTRF
jgi:hypothetical protein